MKNFNKKLFSIFVFFEIFYVFSFTSALVNWPPSPVSKTQLTEQSKLGEMVKYFYEWGIALGGLAAFIALLIAGFQYLTSAGNEARLREAKEKITSAFLGLILLLSSWLILNTINPQLTAFSVEFITPATPTPPVSLEINKESITGTPCQSVTIKETNETITSQENCHTFSWSNSLAPGRSYQLIWNPSTPTSTCSGILYFYQRENCEINAGAASAPQETLSVDVTVRSARLEVPQPKETPLPSDIRE